MMSEKNLKLKVGAQIMLTKNDPSDRWVNGTMGLIHKLEKDKIFIKIGNKVFLVEKVLWEKYFLVIFENSFSQKVLTSLLHSCLFCCIVAGDLNKS